MKNSKVTLVAKKRNLFTIPFTFMGTRGNLNKREDYTGHEELVASIISNGVIQPVMGYVEKNPAKIAELVGDFPKDTKEVWVIVRGHRRYRAMQEIYTTKGVNTTCDFIKEPRGYTDQQRVLDMITSNSGKNFTMIEQANVCKELITTYGMKQTAVAKALGTSNMAVSNLVKLLKATPKVQEMVVSKIVSATTVVELLVSNPPNVVEMMLLGAIAKIEEATATTGKIIAKIRITKKHIEQPVKDTQQETKEGDNTVNNTPKDQTEISPAAKVPSDNLKLSKAVLTGVVRELSNFKSEQAATVVVTIEQIIALGEGTHGIADIMANLADLIA